MTLLPPRKPACRRRSRRRRCRAAPVSRRQCRGRRAGSGLRDQPGSARGQPVRCDWPSNHRPVARREPRRRGHTVLKRPQRRRRHRGENARRGLTGSCRTAAPTRRGQRLRRCHRGTGTFGLGRAPPAHPPDSTCSRFAVCTISTKAWLRVQPRSARTTQTRPTRLTPAIMTPQLHTT